MASESLIDDNDDVAREILVFRVLRVLQAHQVPALDQKKKYNVVQKVIAVTGEWKEILEWWVFLDPKDIQWVLAECYVTLVSTLVALILFFVLVKYFNIFLLKYWYFVLLLQTVLLNLSFYCAGFAWSCRTQRHWWGAGLTWLQGK